MQCPSCGQDNPQEAVFCGECGSRLPHIATTRSSTAIRSSTPTVSRTPSPLSTSSLSSSPALSSIKPRLSKRLSKRLLLGGITLTTTLIAIVCVVGLQVERHVELWRVKDGSLVRTLSTNRKMAKLFYGDQNEAFSAAFSPDGKLLATGRRGGKVDLWRVEDGALQQTLSGDPKAEYSVAFSPDGTKVAAGSFFSPTRMWQVEDGQEIHTLTAQGPDLAFSPDWQLLAERAADNTIKIWRVEDNSELQAISGHMGPVGAIAFSPNGRLLASASYNEAASRKAVSRAASKKDPSEKNPSEKNPSWRDTSGNISGHTSRDTAGETSLPDEAKPYQADIKLWRVEDGSLFLTMPAPAKCLVFSPGTTALLASSGGGDGKISLWRASDGHLIRTIPDPMGQVLGGKLLFRSDANLLAYSNQVWKTWDTRDGVEVLTDHPPTVYNTLSPDWELGVTLKRWSKPGQYQ